jgi:3-dehydroquinate dehydratase type I
VWGDEPKRVAELLRAAELGARIVDIELSTPELGAVVPLIKQKAECLISYHNFDGTPPLGELKRVVERQLEAGADICKVAVKANDFDDNAAVLQLARHFSSVRLIALSMGEAGQPGRLLGPVLNGELAYAALKEGAGSAPGQLTIARLLRFYEAMGL